MSLIKKFFEKKKAELKFKKAGPGHVLAAASSEARGGPSTSSGFTPKKEPASDAQISAATAAMQRLEASHAKTQQQNRSLALIRARARKELEDEQKAALEASDVTSLTSKTVLTDPALLTVTGVYFHCPLLGPEVLPREEMRARISSFLNEQVGMAQGEEKALAACLMIATLNQGEKSQVCIDTLRKYLDNIINNPGEEKYRKIRLGNKTFQERVMALQGAKEFLEGAGFQLQRLVPPNAAEGSQETEDFYVFPPTGLVDQLEILRDALLQTEPIVPQLDRGLRVLKPAEAKEQIHLPVEFFNLTAEELQKERQERAAHVERLATLQTRVMRERAEKKYMKQYRFSLVRIRFPDELILQGTFNVYESFQEVVNYARENMIQGDMSFHFTIGPTYKLSVTEESTLFELGLAPAILLYLVPAEREDLSKPFLKPEIVNLAQSL